jgi:hypothetical protein
MGEFFAYTPPGGTQGLGATSNSEQFLQWAAANPAAARQLIAQIQARRQSKSGNVMRGMGEFFAYTPPGMQGLGGPLVDWARQEEAEAGHKGIFGLGEFFAYTPPGGTQGLGATLEGTEATPWIWAIGAGVAIGTLAVTFSKNSKLGAAGIGAATGIAAVVASRALYG